MLCELVPHIANHGHCRLFDVTNDNALTKTYRVAIVGVTGRDDCGHNVDVAFSKVPGVDLATPRICWTFADIMR